MKKITAILLVVALVAVAIAGSTMAYFSDEAGAVNVATVGNVKIEQHEYERVVENGAWVSTNETDKYGYTPDKLQPYTQAKPLYPAFFADGDIKWDDRNGSQNAHGAGSYQQSWGQVGAPGSLQLFDDSVKNALDKMVFVENTGKSDAYVRTWFAFEQGSVEANEFEKVIMTNTDADHWAWEVVATDVEIDGNEYFVMCATYTGPASNPTGILAPGAVSYPSLLQYYMKPEVTNEQADAIDGNDNGLYEILVYSQAVQTAGFSDAQTALNAAFGTTHPWSDENPVIPIVVDSAEALKTAIEAGETDIVVKGAEITENFFNGHYYKDRNIDFIDCTFTANMNYMYINDATFTNCTFDCGSANSAVHYDELFGDLVFNNCTFKSGKIQIGANKDVTGTVTFNDCVFEQTASTSIWSEAGIRVYSPATFNGCEFNNRVVLAGANGLSITFDSCTMNGGTPVYYVDNTDGIIRGGNIPNLIIH